MAKAEIAEQLRELMAMYDNRRAAWIEWFGSDRGFDAWFTGAVKASLGLGS